MEPRQSGLHALPLLAVRAPVRCVAWSPDGRQLAAALDRGLVRIWEPASAEPIAAGPSGMGKEINALSFSPDGETLAASSEAGLQLWSHRTGEVTALQVDGICLGSAWSSTGREITAALLLGKPPDRHLVLRTWSCADRSFADCRVVAQEEERRWDRATIAISDHLLGISLPGGALEVWDLGRRQCLRRVIATHDEITSLALSPQDGSLVAAFGRALEVWVGEGKPDQALPFDSAPVHSLAFSPGGEILASWSEAGEVKLWWWRDRRPVAKLSQPAERGRRPDLAFAPLPDGHGRPRLATFTDNATAIQVWDLDLDDLRIVRHPMKTILFLSADPNGTLRVDVELREIRDALEQGRHRDLYSLQAEMAVRAKDLTRALTRLSPQFVHFAGHSNTSGFVVEGNGLSARDLASNKSGIGVEGDLANNQSGLVVEGNRLSTRALARLFAVFSATLECLVLNSCSSAEFAVEIAKSIPYVIGMSQRILDQAAVAFALAFYQALGEGSTIERAYQLGCVYMDLVEQPGYDLPVLYKHGKVLPRVSAPSGAEVQ